VADLPPSSPCRIPNKKILDIGVVIILAAFNPLNRIHFFQFEVAIEKTQKNFIFYNGLGLLSILWQRFMALADEGLNPQPAAGHFQWTDN
jgi:hypothetical protein